MLFRKPSVKKYPVDIFSGVQGWRAGELVPKTQKSIINQE